MKYFNRPQTRNSTVHRRRGAGFTLVEITVVLAIAAVVTAISLGSFHEMRAVHKRTGCQTNLMQIYQALRLYSADEGGKMPYLEYADNTQCHKSTPSGIGLWALYTYPISGDATASQIAPLGDAPTGRYLRSSKPLHCPNDYQTTGGYTNTQLYAPGRTAFNPNFLSYQTCEDTVPPADISEPTYASVRTRSKSNIGLWKRQLLHFDGSTAVSRPPADDTVVLWCKHHRGLRSFDNVLFYDGSVQLLASEPPSENWQRMPKPPS